MRLGIFGQADSLYVRLLHEAAVARGHDVHVLSFQTIVAEVRAGRCSFQAKGFPSRRWMR